LLRPKTHQARRLFVAAAVLFAFVASWHLWPGGAVPAMAPAPETKPSDGGLDTGLWVQLHETSGRPQPRVAVLVNSRPVAYFRTEDAAVQVNPEDLIEIDGTRVAQVLFFSVTAVGDAVLVPSPGTYAATWRSIAIVGRVQIRRPDTVAVLFLARRGLDFVLVPVKRVLPPAAGNQDVLEQAITTALAALLAGPTQAEQKEGIFTLLPPGTTLHRVDVEGDVAYLDIDGRAESGAVPETLSLRLAEIVGTVLEFPAVREVVLMVDGEIVGPERPFGAGGPAPDRLNRAWLPVPVERPLPAVGP